MSGEVGFLSEGLWLSVPRQLGLRDPVFPLLTPSLLTLVLLPLQIVYKILIFFLLVCLFVFFKKGLLSLALAYLELTL